MWFLRKLEKIIYAQLLISIFLLMIKLAYDGEDRNAGK
jgi:hypothetical protein